MYKYSKINKIVLDAYIYKPTNLVSGFGYLLKKKNLYLYYRLDYKVNHVVQYNDIIFE